MVILIFAHAAIMAENEEVGSNDTTNAAGVQNEISGDDVYTPSVTETVLPSMTRIGLSLMVIVIIIYLAVFALRKFSGNSMGGKKGKTVQIIEQTYLAPKKSVFLLKLADRAVLVGVTDTNINMLTEFDLDVIPRDVIERVEKQQGGFPGFLSAATGKLLGGKGNRGEQRDQTR
jgi:flagellar protein FliO/FliZ